MSHVYIAWNKRGDGTEKIKFSFPVPTKNYYFCPFQTRVCMYQDAKNFHMNQLNNECIGLAMLVKEGCLSKDMQRYIRDKYVYRDVPLPKKESNTTLQELRNDFKFLGRIFLNHSLSVYINLKLAWRILLASLSSIW
jgi:hypothetical protein